MPTDDTTASADALTLVRPRKRWVGFGVLGVCVLVGVWGMSHIERLNTPPETFPLGQDIVIAEGNGMEAITQFLEHESVVRSATYLGAVLHLSHSDAYIQAGSYRFDAPLTTKEVARVITEGSSITPPESVTFPEGFRVAQLPKLLPERYRGDVVVERLIPLEGYLFPDTYFVTEDDSLELILTRMQDTFDARITPFFPDIEAQGLSLKEVVTLASILEREANDETSMKLVAGILFNRLAIGMPLQVDATLEYERGKGSSELTYEDLETDSPYNTYTNVGLPPTPIANPGMVALDAVLNPTPSEYFYYLTAPDGTFYYAETFAEHKRNKAKYLR